MNEYALHHGDCLEVLKTLSDNSIDAVVTDPPYHLTSIVERFGKTSIDGNGTNERRAKAGADGMARLSRGFMGKQWDGGDIAQNPALWSEVLRVLKPGGHCVAFSGTRTYHRMACAIEDAGFEVRDQLAWAYGTGFPKSHDVSKAIDKAAGVERTEVVGSKLGRPGMAKDGSNQRNGFDDAFGGEASGVMPTDILAPATDAARQWEGWGTALKPSFEPLVLATKPFTNNELSAIIGSYLRRLEARLWLMSFAKDAEQLSELSRSECGMADALGFAQWTAENVFNTRAALCAQMDMSLFESALISSLNTVSSWNDTWAESSILESTSTTGTKSSTTIDLKIWKFSLSKITPESIIQAHKTGQWSSANASSAERYLNADAMRLNATRELSAIENALSEERISSPEGIGRIGPASNPICLARKPLSEKTVAANVLRWGTGAINVDGCRVATEENLNGGAYAADKNKQGGIYGKLDYQCGEFKQPVGRFPANLCHDGSQEVLDLFPDSVSRQASGVSRSNGVLKHGGENSRPSHGTQERVSGTEGFSDSGSVARFFYCSKASKSDRIVRDVEEVTIEWTSDSGPCQARLQVDTEQSVEKAIVVLGSGTSKEWNTFLFGSTIADLSQTDTKFIISTETNSTTELKILSCWTRSLISVCTQAANCETAFGLSHAESAARYGLSLTITSDRMVYLPGASRAMSGTPLTISVSARRHSHPTTKPVKLMQWLCRMVTPPGGIVLDPFAGSGTTGAAALLEGFQPILIECEDEYVADIRRRLIPDAQSRPLAALPRTVLPLFADVFFERASP